MDANRDEEAGGASGVATEGTGHRTIVDRMRLAAGDIKLAHSVFAMPFAVLGAFLARGESEEDRGWGRFGGQVVLIVVCMVLARSWAMLVNRLADRSFDAANPRTRRRVMASGKLSAASGRVIALACAGAFVLVTGLFWVLFENVWPVVLSVPVLVWIAFYSYIKRFTWMCHVFLGGALAASPIAAAIAVNPIALGEGESLWWLAGMVLLWVSGFDVIYALQDVEFDRGAGLFSVPSRLGVGRAIWISRGLHVGAYLCLAMAVGGDDRFGMVMWGAWAAVGGLLVMEHVVLAKRGQAGLDMAFFTLNGVVSCVLGVAGVVDLAVV